MQVETIQRAYAPSEAGESRPIPSPRDNRCIATDAEAIRKAARVKFSFELNDAAGKGAYGLDGVMIDAPVYKQALNVLRIAQTAGLSIPTITEKDIQ